MSKYIQKLGSLYNRIKRSKYEHVSYSQSGEDIIIRYIFLLRNMKQFSYLDLGANQPFFLNNTALFYMKGCRGVNVEANSGLIELFQKQRPADLNLNIGVGPEEGTLEFYVFEDDTLSTFSLGEVEQLKASGLKVDRIEKIKILTLDHILSEYLGGRFPDLLSIDVEGYDFEIIKSADFSSNKPKVICAETAEYSPIGAGKKREDYIQYILNQGYYLYADTNINSIFVEKDFWFNYPR
jgi:FkbM family methyltransferase